MMRPWQWQMYALSNLPQRLNQTKSQKSRLANHHPSVVKVLLIPQSLLVQMAVDNGLGRHQDTVDVSAIGLYHKVSQSAAEQKIPSSRSSSSTLMLIDVDTQLF